MKIGLRFAVDARSLPGNADEVLRPLIARECGISQESLLDYEIVKRSLDARQKPAVKVLYFVTAQLRDGTRPRPAVHAQLEAPWQAPEPPRMENLSGVQQPLVVGAGPAGLFAALVLAQAGAKPIVLERGRDVERRRRDIDDFFASRTLNPESNLLYGEGGAGTWSDGKLFTRVKDPRGHFVLQSFVSAGAQPEILYYAHPHIGSDRLPGVIAALRQKICSLGGTFLWETQVTDLLERNGRFHALRLSDGSTIDAPAALIACGHSARSLIEALSRRVSSALKGFQIGCRIEHPQSFINETQFGMQTAYPALGPAEYLYSAEGATTFCMCPGGEILPATCEEAALCTNGMSNAARDGRLANSAVITTIGADAFDSPTKAFEFLHDLESRQFQAGGNDYTAPAQTARDFLAHRTGVLPRESSYRLGLTPGRLDEILPPAVATTLANAIRAFDRSAPGFVAKGTFVGIETRVSSPVKFLRNPETLATSLPGLYMAGEGGGMAGGIVSAAIDGIRLAQKILGCE